MSIKVQIKTSDLPDDMDKTGFLKAVNAFILENVITDAGLSTAEMLVFTIQNGSENDIASLRAKGFMVEAYTH